ncbi:MAG: SHOCT domain-containing protein [Nitrospirae bacterium]|nr:MAG: SHOCT domain-containing protein [Nitrospirota bacterium]
MVRLDSPLFTRQTLSVSQEFPPVQFTEAQLRRLLGSIRIRREMDFLDYYLFRKEAKPEPALTQEELTLLVPPLRTALLKARSNETVVFVIKRVDDKGIPRMTSGGVILAGRQLAVVLAHLREPVASERGQQQIFAHPLVPYRQPAFHIVAGGHQTPVTSTSSVFSLPEPTTAPAVLLGYEALRETVQPASPGRAPLQATPESTLTPGSSAGRQRGPEAIAAKLRRLKQWYEEGLITEQDYRQKKKALLEAF